MRPITAALLVAATGCASRAAAQFADPVDETARRYAISSPIRLAAFLAQVGHESGSLGRTVENLNYSADLLLATWPARFTREMAEQMARKPEAIANHVYGGRLGNDSRGDGWKYRGRGLIQVTGKTNYEAITEGLAEKLGESVPDFVLQPDLLSDPRWSALSAGCYWDDRHLNELADMGEFDKITTRINGGQHGKADRRARFSRAMKALAS